MGDQVYQTSTSEYTDGRWNEGFEFSVTYHAQLFDTIQLDVYDSYKLLPDRHVGRAEIRLIQLHGMPDTFTNYYEIWDKKLTSGASSHAARKTSNKTNVGALHAKICYHFQQLHQIIDDPSCDELISDDATTTTTTATTSPSPAPVDQQSKDEQRFMRHLQRDRDASSINFCKYESNVEEDGPPVSGDDGEEDVHGQQSSPDDSDASDSLDPLLYAVRRTSLKSDSAATPLHQPTSTSLFSSWFSGSAAPAPPVDKSTATGNIQQAQRDLSAYSSLEALGNDDEDSLKTFPLLDKIGAWTMGKETNQCFRAIIKLLLAIGQGYELSPLQIWTGLTVVEKFYQELPRDRTWDVVTDLNELQLVAHLWRFSMAAYGWKGLNFIGKGNGYLSDAVRSHSDTLSIMEHLALPKENLLAYEFRGEAFRPSYFVARDQATNSIVLSIRGTMSVLDAMTDLVCDYEPWKGGLVHKGMKASALWFFHHVGPKLIAYTNAHATSALYIVGHSLGAATAAILTIMLLDYMDEFKKGKSGDFTLQCIGYAPACGLSLNLSEKYKDHIQSIVFGDDIVSKLCYGTVMDVKQMLIAGSEAARHLDMGELWWAGDPTSDDWKQAFKEVAECRQRCLESNENPKLFIAGKVYQFWLDPIPNNETRVIVERTTPEKVSREIILKKSTIFDHLPNVFDLSIFKAMETVSLPDSDTSLPTKTEPDSDENFLLATDDLEKTARTDASKV
ncbi:hypothetical protein DM01DRAFT_1336298 [Hesseltinella vesiculosa]|uniref:sn-1-specific diacylglycerol lipase n=1 Tax=Hesseltinella vesiculosa TaxID=101127 RepID=A0A1X2GGC5_9FUNG|nr:hypothetical protein DM01DRAFT_1336298 [Hesseltinella vesiculosa]